jgi:hypothetical protein
MRAGGSGSECLVQLRRAGPAPEARGRMVASGDGVVVWAIGKLGDIVDVQNSRYGELVGRKLSARSRFGDR